MAIYVNGTKVAGNGLPGQDGANGKSAYQAAIDGGYSGTEQEFNQALGNLNQLFTSVSDGKSVIAAAITDKGVTTAADATFQQMADNIGSISSGDAEWSILHIDQGTQDVPVVMAPDPSLDGSYSLAFEKQPYCILFRETYGGIMSYSMISRNYLLSYDSSWSCLVDSWGPYSASESVTQDNKILISGSLRYHTAVEFLPLYLTE